MKPHPWPWPHRPRRFIPRVEGLEARTLLSGGAVVTFGGNSQHTGLFQPAAQNLSTIKWQTPVDLAPQYSDGDLFIHYGSPLITANNTVLVPVKTGASGGFEVNAFNGASGASMYTLATDYLLPPHNWTPSYAPALVTTSSSTRLYYAGAGGTIYYLDNPDSSTPGTPVHQVFYTTLANYTANASSFNSTVFVDTPITSDSNGDIFFGFRVENTAPAPLSTTKSGFARIDPNGNAIYVLANNAAGDSSISLDSHNSAPALSNDGSTLYVAVKASTNGGGYLLGLDSTTLATKYKVLLKDPRNNNNAGILDDGTASPMVGPDGDVYFGIMGSPFNGSRGFLLHFNSTLTQAKTPGAFGWDYTAAVVPTSMVPGYNGTSPYLLFSKYNNYATTEVGGSGGDGVNQVAILDPDAAETDPRNDGNSGLQVMREVLIVPGPTPDPGLVSPSTPHAVREWCINTAAVDPASDSVFFPSEDGKFYQWRLDENTLIQTITLGTGIGEAYVPTVVGPDGTVFSINNATLFAVGNQSGDTVSVISSSPDVRTTITGQSITFTASVVNTGSPGQTPTGTIAFMDGSTTLATVSIDSNGNASYATSSLTAGAHFIAAVYSGDSNFSAGTATLVQFVHASATTTTLAAAPNPSTFGNAITLTATVTPAVSGLGSLTGTVTFLDGSNFLGQVPVGNGSSTFTTSTLAVGSHTITAIYNSDLVYATSSGNDAANPLVVNYTPGDLIVTRVGTGSSSLTNFATATFLDDYTTAGAQRAGNTVALPTAANTATITTASEAGNTVTVTTAAPHGFVNLQNVLIAGVSVAGYNGVFVIVSVPTSTTFSYQTSTTGLGSGTGGTASVAGDALTETGASATATAGGYLTNSADGHSLSIMGYNQLPGLDTLGPKRVVGAIGPSGAVNTTTQLPSSSGDARAAVAADGFGFWIATSNRLGYVPLGNSAATSAVVVTNELLSANTVGISTSGQLFASAASPTQPNGVPAIYSPFTVGTGLPDIAGQAIAVSPSFPAVKDAFGYFPSTNQFAVSPDGKTIYLADSRTDSLGGILKYYQSTPNNWVLVSRLQLNTFAITDAKESGTTVTITTSSAYSFPAGQNVEIDGVGTGYNGSYTITPVDATHFTYLSNTSSLVEVTNAGFATSTDGGLRALVADFSGAHPVLYATTTAATTTAGSANRLVKLADSGDLNGNGGSFTATTLATAPANEAFRGVALAPTAPGSMASTTILSVSSSPGTYGTGVTLTAVVTSGATGWVSFRVGGVEIGAAPVVSGTARFTTAGNLGAGTYNNLVAVYTGNSTYAPSTSPAQLATINQYTTSTTLSAAANPAGAGVSDLLTATLTFPAGTAPTGTVAFTDTTTNTTLGTANVSQVIMNQNGNPVIEFVATLSATFSTIQTHNLSAVYSGDANFTTSTGTTSVVVVNVTTTTVTTSNASPTATPSATVTLTATLTNNGNSGGTPTGSVQFFDNLLPIGNPVTLSSGVATVSVSTALIQAASGNPDVLTPGLHAISAVYTPDAAGQNTFLAGSGVYEQSVQGLAFAAGDEFVERVGDGTTPIIASSGPNAGIASIGNTIFVDEYTPSGTLVQSLILPSADSPRFAISTATESGTTVTITTTTPVGFTAGQQVTITQTSLNGYNGTFTITSVPTATSFTYTASSSGLGNAVGGTAAGTIHAVVADGQQQATGQMSLSGDGQFLFLTGYDSNPLNPATAPQLHSSNTTSRAVARIKYDGTIQTLGFFAGSGGVQTAGNFNGVYSPDGNRFYISGYNGIDYFSSFTPSAALRFYNEKTNNTAPVTGLQGVGGNLYAEGLNYATTVSLLGQVGTGFPVSAASIDKLPGLPSADNFQQSPIDAYFTHLGGTGAPTGANTLYLSDNGPSFANGRITKWALINNSITSATESGNTVTITTSSATGLVPGETVTIAGVGVSGYNGTFIVLSVSGSTLTYFDYFAGLANSSGGNAVYWNLVDTVTAGTGNSAVSFFWLNGKTDGSDNVTLYATYGNGGNSNTGPGFLYALSDANGWNAPLGTGGGHSDAVSTVASVGSTSNEVFRGVAAAPLPAVASVVVNGSIDTFTIVKATESDTTVTITTQAAPDFAVGQQVMITGVGVAEYNGTFTLTAVSGSTFTYTAASSGLGAASGGSATGVSWAIATATETATTVTITTTAAHGLYVGQHVTIAGDNVSGYNGTFMVTGVSGTMFTYTDANTGLADGSGGTVSVALAGAQRSMVDSIVYKFNQPVSLPAPLSISTATESGTTVTITTAGAHGFSVGQTVTTTGVSVAGYNGTFTVTSVTATTFTYTDSNSGLGSGSGGNAQVGFSIAVHPGQSGTLPTLNYSSPDGGLTWILTFAGAGVAGNSIGDGVYDILLNQSAVTYNYSGATLTQSNRATDTFFRLYGDSNGDQIVNAVDNFKFKNAFGTSSGDSGYLAYFDYNDDGIINAADNFQFKKRFGVSFGGFTPTI